MLHQLFTLTLLAVSLTVVAQAESTSQTEPAPWLFLDARVSVGFVDIRTGVEYTTTETRTSQAVRMMARKSLNPLLSVGAGVGLGTRSFRLASTYDRYLRQQFPPNTFGNEIDWFNRLEYADMYLELPFELRAEVLSIGPGRLFLRAGTSWLIPLAARNDNYRVYGNRPEPALMPDARLESPVTNFISAGIGYRAISRGGSYWYLELNYEWATSETVRSVPPDQQDPRSRHFPDLGVQQLGIVFGVGVPPRPR